MELSDAETLLSIANQKTMTSFTSHDATLHRNANAAPGLAPGKYAAELNMPPSSHTIAAPYATAHRTLNALPGAAPSNHVAFAVEQTMLPSPQAVDTQTEPVQLSSGTAADATSVKLVRGRGLSWNDDENTALAMIAQSVCSDPARGNDMKTAKFHRLLRLKFVQHSECPPLELMGENDDGPLDPRRWHGRSERAVGRQWAILKAECHKFEEAMQLVRSSSITGNPDENQLLRCATALYNAREDGYGASTVTPHFTDICKNQYYRIGKPFPFIRAHQHLSKHTSLITAHAASAYTSQSTSDSTVDGDILPTDDADACSKEVENARPSGTKIAKRLKKRKHDADEKLNEHIASISSAMQERNAAREKRDTERLALKKQKLAFQKFSVLFGPSSAASEEERAHASSLMREAFMKDLLTGVGTEGTNQK